MKLTDKQYLHRPLQLCFIGMVLLSLTTLAAAEQRRRTVPHTHTVNTVLPGNNSSWRPYANPQVLVTLGMTKAEVLLKAGSPALEEVVSLGTDGHLNQSVWTYIQRGHNASVTTLTFQGNKLARIDIKLNP